MAKRFLFIILGLLAMFAGVYAVLALTSKPVPDHPFFDRPPGEVLVIAHRGGRGLWPENTLYAFEQATRLGVDVLEMDVGWIADGTLVVMHDDTVDRTTDGTGPLREMGPKELAGLDAGHRFTRDEGRSYPYRGRGIAVPTLREVFTAFPRMRMNLEIKPRDPGIAEPFCRLIREFDMSSKILVASVHSQVMRAFREQCPAVATSAVEAEVRVFFALSTVRLSAVYRSPAEALQVPEWSGELQVITRRFVRSAKEHNLDVHVWTVNEPEAMRRVIDLGVGGIITDYPDRLLALLGRAPDPAASAPAVASE